MKERSYDHALQRRWEERLRRRPICRLCRLPVDSELCLELGGGEAVCEGCMGLHTRYTEDLEYA